jgi:hypothetical protein
MGERRKKRIKNKNNYIITVACASWPVPSDPSF